MKNHYYRRFTIDLNTRAINRLDYFNDSFSLNPINKLDEITISSLFTTDNAIIHNLIHGYIQMGHLNQIISNEFLSCEEGANEKLKYYLNHSK